MLLSLPKKDLSGLVFKVINGTDIEFSVTDTGIGISDESKKNYF